MVLPSMRGRDRDAVVEAALRGRTVALGLGEQLAEGLALDGGQDTGAVAGVAAASLRPVGASR
jgi:hypothetical protein